MQSLSALTDQLVSSLSEYQWVVVIGAVAIGAAMVREMLQSTSLAIFAMPTILVGALIANYLFQVRVITAATDKDTNIVIATALGSLVAICLLLLVRLLIALMHETISKSKKI